MLAIINRAILFLCNSEIPNLFNETLFKLLARNIFNDFGNNLKKLNIIYKGVSLSKEIIVVDANSTDNSDKILKKVNEIRYFKIKNLGRGHSIRYGINKSNCKKI